MNGIGYPSRAKQWGADKIRDFAYDNGLRLVHGYEATARRSIDGTALGDKAADMLPYNNQKDVLVDDQDTNDIIKWIKKEHPVNAKHYDKIADMFWRDNATGTSAALFRFMKDNVHYDVEHPEHQTVKTPGAILHHGYGDCKHYASFITGICCALNKMGYPIEARYRFTADRPGMEVHHVFAVVTDPATGQEYWNDPVLGSYDLRPKYHNIKDVAMPLYRISGTEQEIGSLPEGLQEFIHRYGRHRGHNNVVHHVSNVPDKHARFQGMPLHNKADLFHMADTAYSSYIGKHKKKHRNVFKEIAHGFEVNAKNVKHGYEVNAKNLAKEAKKGLDKAKHLILKVSLSAARGPFLSLVDINAFNLAHRYRDTLMGPKRNDLLRTWRDLGGKERAFINAVNNGYRAYKKHHGGWDQKRDRVNGTGCVGYIAGHQIGVIQVAAWLALASAIIAALGKFAGHSKEEKQQMADAGKEGADMLIKNGSDGIDMANGEAGAGGAAAMDMAVSNPNTPSMKVSTGTDENGNPVLAVHDVQHPAIPQAGLAPMDGASPDDVPGGGGQMQTLPQANVPGAPAGPGAFDIAFGKAKNFFMEHTGAILAVTVGGGAVYYLSTRKRTRKR